MIRLYEENIEKIFGFRLIATKSYDYQRFIDVRRTNGIYTANAIYWPYEYEYVIGKHYVKRNIPKYMSIALLGLSGMSDKIKKDKGLYLNTIKRAEAWS